MENVKFDLALRYYRQGQVDLAIEQLKELLANDPQHAIAHALLAECLLSQKRLYAAEYEIKVALQLDPCVAYFFLVSARVEMFKNNFDHALSCCDEALALNPSEADALLLKAEIFTHLEKSEQAHDALTQAASLEPDNMEISLAFARHFMAAGKLDRANILIEEALAVYAQNVDANILMGRLRLLQGDVVDAEYHAKFAISQNPYSSEALRLFVDIKMHKSRFLGLWWRFNTWAARLSSLKGAVVLILAFLFFNLISQVLSDIGFSQAASLVSYAWLAAVLYSWMGLPMYTRALRKELDSFRFGPKF